MIAPNVHTTDNRVNYLRGEKVYVMSEYIIQIQGNQHAVQGNVM